MSRLIDADALEELFREVIGGIAKKPEINGNLEHMIRASAMVIEMIKDAPTIEPERKEEFPEECQKCVFSVFGIREPERKKGRWIEQDDSWDGVYYECSVCREPWTTIDGTPWDNGMNYCPNCGAEMEKE